MSANFGFGALVRVRAGWALWTHEKLSDRGKEPETMAVVWARQAGAFTLHLSPGGYDI